VEADEAVSSEGNIEGATRRDIVPEACSRDSTGVEEPEHAWRGSPRNLGVPVSSVERRNRGWRAQAKPSGAGGTSERAIVVTKRGNRAEGPRGAKGAPGHGTVRGKDGRDIGLAAHLNAT
jgi:hypothetical protein